MAHAHSKNSLVQFISKSSGEWLQEADEYAQSIVHLDARRAWSDVNSGRFGGLGTPFADELEQLVTLAGVEELPIAAE